MPWNPERYNVKPKPKINEDAKFYLQTYKSKNWLDKWSTVYYHGPLLDKRLFKNLKVDKKK